MQQEQRLLIIDGNSLIHRAFHALPLLTNSRGTVTNASYGFTNMLYRIIKEEDPDYLIVAFDKGKHTFRHEIFGDYKGMRSETPEELRPQFAQIKEILECMHIKMLELDDFEADDLIGTATLQAEEQGIYSLILTGDKDDFQLISDKTQVLYTKKGISELELYDLDKLQERFGVTPEQFIDMKGLMGDPSDNIPGVPGIGEKTARKLLDQFGSLQAILEKPEEAGKRWQEKLIMHADLARLSRQLAEIERRAPIDIDWEECKLQSPDWNALLQKFNELEFKGLANSVRRQIKAGTAELPEDEPAEPRGSSGQDEENVSDAQISLFSDLSASSADQDEAPDGQTSLFGGQDFRAEKFDYHILQKDNDLQIWEDFKTIVSDNGWMAVHFSDDINCDRPLQDQNSCLALASGDHVIVWEPDFTMQDLSDRDISDKGNKTENTAKIWDEICALMTDDSTDKYFHDAKRAYRLLWRSMPEDRKNERLKGIAFDSMVAAYILNPGRDSSDLAVLALEYDDTVLPEKQPDRTACEARTIVMLHKLLPDQLVQEGFFELYDKIELPLVEILARMEANGVRVEPQQIGSMSENLSERIEVLRSAIYDLAGEKFNINSSKQLGSVLFEKMELPVIKKTKTGYSTDAEVLEELAVKHEIAALILEYRQLVKLKSTYLDGLLPLIDQEDGRIHTTFNQTVTVTGRLSSTEPNLQNIPVRLELGRQIRRLFVPHAADHIILAADYSQIELRVLAHMSGDERMIDAFCSGLDFHTQTASEVNGVPLEEVTAEMRSRAKAVNFGIIYGISDFGLAKDIKVTRKMAKQYIDSYFERYPGVKRFIDDTIRDAYKKGYVTTMFNRRRYLPDLLSKNHAVRKFGERTAMNTPIQGTAADIIKIAMIKVQNEMDKRQLKSEMILQVHDELIFDVTREELPEMISLVREQMENVAELSVPLLVDIKAGPSWYDVRKLKDDTDLNELFIRSV